MEWVLFWGSGSPLFVDDEVCVARLSVTLHLLIYFDLCLSRTFFWEILCVCIGLVFCIYLVLAEIG